MVFSDVAVGERYLMFSARLEPMCTAISSSLEINMFCFANQDLFAIRFWLTWPD